MWIFSRAGLARIFWHAESVAPEECCGILVGRCPDPADDPEDEETEEIVWVEQVVAAANTLPAAARRRGYRIAPETLLSVHREARELGRRIVGYYHSHPGAPARPSARDHAEAWPGDGHVIVSLAAGRVVEMRCWHLRSAQGEFEERPWRAGPHPETRPGTEFHPEPRRPRPTRRRPLSRP